MMRLAPRKCNHGNRYGPALVVEGNFRHAGGEEAMRRRLLAGAVRPDAVLADNERSVSCASRRRAGRRRRSETGGAGRRGARLTVRG